MAIKGILATIDAEITRLKQARALLAQDGDATLAMSTTKDSRKRKMSAAGRKRIAEAQRKRWAALKTKKK